MRLVRARRVRPVRVMRVRPPGQSVPSTRYKDLVNLVAILTKVSVRVDAQQQALESEAERRGLILPSQFDVPTIRCGTPATAQKHGARSSPWPAPWTRRQVSCGPSQTHSFSGPPPASGNPPPAGGPGNPATSRVFAAATAAHRVRPVCQEPGATPNAIPEITNRGVSARPRRRDGRVGSAAS